MLVSAVAAHDLVLAVHILSAIVGFGVVFAFPLIVSLAARTDPSLMPFLLRARQRVGRFIVNPGLTVLMAAGIYLATDEHQWGSFYVGWGLFAGLVIGALEGSIIIRRAGRMATAAERDLAASAVPGPGGGQRVSAQWSEAYLADLRVLTRASWALMALVVITVFLMATHAGS